MSPDEIKARAKKVFSDLVGIRYSGGMQDVIAQKNIQIIVDALHSERQKQRERDAEIAKNAYTVCSVGQSGPPEAVEPGGFQRVPYSPKEIAKLILEQAFFEANP